MKRGSRLRWIGILALAVFAASVATAAAGAGSSADKTKPSKPAFSAPVAGQMKPAGTMSARSVPRVHRRHDEDAEVDPPSRGLLLRRAGISQQARAVPLSGNASTNLARPTAGKRASHRAAKRTARPDSGAKLPRGSDSGFVGAAMEKLNSFSGATLNNTGCCEPPDTQVAVSSNWVFEPVNLTAFLFDHGGNSFGSFDLVSFMSFNQPNNFGSDPKVVYDAGTDRFYMVLMLCQQGACGGNWTTMGVSLAVSQTNNPFGSWTIYSNIYSGNPFFDQGNLQDQPKLGFSGDKVTISDNVYSDHCGSGSCFLHEDVITWNKAELLAGGTAHYVGFTSGYAFDSIPAIPSPTSATSTNTQFVAWQGFGSLGVNQITGLPNVSSVNQSTQSPGIGNMTGTVNAAGVPAGAQSGNFVEAATWNNDRLWAASTDGCTRGTGTVDCTRIDEINTTNRGSVSVLLDQNIGDAGAYEIYPSVTQDCLGDLMWGITYSDGSTLPAATMIGTTTPGSGYIRFEYAFGDTTYSGGRWGDYSGVQEDPSDCGNVWTAQEYGAVGSSGNWDTAMGQFSFDSPFISSTSPSSGPATGGTTVDIFGFDFVNGGTSVKFGGAFATGVTFVDAHHIRAISPAGSGGPVSISATTANGTSTNSQFSWVPAVTGLNPTAGPTSGGNSVEIFGAGFTGATSVTFGGVAASFTVNNDGDISATAPPNSAGAVDVRVAGPTGTSATSFADIYTYDVPPTLTSVIPTAGPLAGGNTVTIHGTNFTSGATVRFGPTASPLVTFVSATKLLAKAPAHPAGVVNVTVRTPGGTTPVVTADRYTYEASPSVSSVVPNGGGTAGGNTITINGANFVSGATVAFGTTASPVVTFVSAAKLTAKVPAHGAGTVHVRVTTPGGTSPLGNGDLYAFGAPTVSSVVPTGGSTAGGNTVTINGTGLVPGATVKFGTTAATVVTFVSPNQITAKAPAHAAGTVHVRVTTPGGTSAIGNRDLYAFGAPTVTGVVPNGGSTAGGNTVTINGTGFVPGATVKFGTAASTLVTFVSPTQIKAKAPAHSAGAVNVRVTTPGGVSPIVSGDLYTYA